MLSSKNRPMAHNTRNVKAAGADWMKNAPLAPYVMLALAFIGIADTLYDSYAIYNGQLLWCPPPIDGCNIVASSPFGRVIGIPLGYFGLLNYSYMFGLVALLAFDPYSRGLR